MGIDTQKKPHLQLVTDPIGKKWWTGTFRGLVYFGRSPTHVMDILRLYFGDDLPCA